MRNQDAVIIDAEDRFDLWIIGSVADGDRVAEVGRLRCAERDAHALPHFRQVNEAGRDRVFQRAVDALFQRNGNVGARMPRLRGLSLGEASISSNSTGPVECIDLFTIQRRKRRSSQRTESSVTVAHKLRKNVNRVSMIDRAVWFGNS